jgi:hypothetical protein
MLFAKYWDMFEFNSRNLCHNIGFVEISRDAFLLLLLSNGAWMLVVISATSLTCL